MAEPTKEKHDHLEIHALVDGGYVIREGRFHSMTRDRSGEAVWNWHQERAAFATLEDALTWLSQKMVRKSPDV